MRSAAFLFLVVLAALAVGALAKDTYCPLNSDSCGGIDSEQSQPFDSFFYCDGNAVLESAGVCGEIAQYVEGYKPVVIGATGTGQPIVFAARKGETADSRFAGFTEMVYFVCTSWDCSSISTISILDGFNGNEAIALDHVVVGGERLLVVAGAGKLVAVPGHTKASRPLYEVMYGYCVDAECSQFHTRVLSADLEESFSDTDPFALERNIVGDTPAAASRSNGKIVEVRTFGSGANQRMAMIFMLGNDYESALMHPYAHPDEHHWWGFDTDNLFKEEARSAEERGWFDDEPFVQTPLTGDTPFVPMQSSWAVLSICVNPPTCTEREDQLIYIGNANQMALWDTPYLGDLDNFYTYGSGSGSGLSPPPVKKEEERQVNIEDLLDQASATDDFFFALNYVSGFNTGGFFTHGRAPLAVFTQRPTPNMLVASPQGLWLSFVGLHDMPNNQVFDTMLQNGNFGLFGGSGIAGSGNNAGYFSDPSNGFGSGSGAGGTETFKQSEERSADTRSHEDILETLLESNTRLPPKPKAGKGASAEFWSCGTDGLNCRRAWNHDAYQHLFVPQYTMPIGIFSNSGAPDMGFNEKAAAQRDLLTPYDASASYLAEFTSSVRNQIPDPQLGWQFAASRQGRDRRTRLPETLLPPTATEPFTGAPLLFPHDPRNDIWNEFRNDNTYQLSTTTFAVGAAGNGFPATVGVVRDDEPSGLGWSIVLAICLSDTCDKQVYRYLMDSATLHDNWGLLDDPMSGANEIINHPDGSWTIVLFVSPQSESTSVEWSRLLYDNPYESPRNTRVADGTPNSDNFDNFDNIFMATYPHGHEGTSGKPLFITCLDELCSEASLSTVAPTRTQTMIPSDLGTVDVDFGAFYDTLQLPKEEYAASFAFTWLGQFGPMKTPLMKRFYSSRPHSFAFTGPNSENLLVAIRDISLSANWDAPNYSPLRFWATNRYASPTGEPCSHANVGATVVSGEAVFVCTRLNTGSAAVMGGISGWVRYYEWVDVSKAFSARLWANIPAGISPFGVQPSIFQQAKPGMQYPQNLGAVYFDEQDQLAASVFDGELSNEYFGNSYDTIFDFYGGYVDYPHSSYEAFVSAYLMNTPSPGFTPKVAAKLDERASSSCYCPPGEYDCYQRCGGRTSTQYGIAEFDCEEHRSDYSEFSYCSGAA